MTARLLFREGAMFGDGLLGWGEGGPGPPTHLYFVSVSAGTPNELGQRFWLAERILLWCRVAHNGTTVGMPIVLCLEITHELSIAERDGQNYAAPEWKQSWDC